MRRASKQSTVKFRFLVALGLCAACSGGDRWGSPDAASEDDEPRRGGWDANSGNFNGNIGLWQLVAGIGMDPVWAPGGTGRGTLNNAMIYGLRPQAVASGPCEAPTAGVTAVNFLSSSGTVGAATGPDVEVVRGATSARLAADEEVVFTGLAFDGYGRSIDATFSVTRVDTLVRSAAPWYAWPVFALMVCEHARPLRGYVHLGYVSWAPMMRLPELPGESFVFPDPVDTTGAFPNGVVMPITTVARPEYAGDPDVPAVVKRQTGALWFKFAFYASLPVALRNEAALAFRTSHGDTIENVLFVRDGASSLGNMSWTSTPAEMALPVGQRHRFQTFFTRDGTEVAMFAVARGDGGSHGALRYPTAWGEGVIAALELTPAELSADVAWQVDAVHGTIDDGLMAVGDRWAAEPTHVGSGLSTFRVGRFLSSSSNDWRMELYAQRESRIRAARWFAPIDGKIESQDEIRRFALEQNSPADYLVCAQSPLVPGKEDMGGNGGIVPVMGGVDAGVDAATVDAPMTPDAGVDAAQLDAPLVPDASVDASPPDAPLVPDAGPDASPPDALPPDDAGLDADATDATLDAVAEAGSEDAACAVSCDDAGADAF